MLETLTLNFWSKSEQWSWWLEHELCEGRDLQYPTVPLLSCNSVRLVDALVAESEHLAKGWLLTEHRAALTKGFRGRLVTVVRTWPQCSKWWGGGKNFQNMQDIIWFIYEKWCTMYQSLEEIQAPVHPVGGWGKEHVVRCRFLCIFCEKFTKILVNLGKDISFWRKWKRIWFMFEHIRSSLKEK